MKAEQLVVGALGLAALLLSLWIMFSRYLYPSLAPDWGEEVVVYLLTWSTWIACSKLTFDKAHIQTDLLLMRLSANKALQLSRFHAFTGLALSSAFCVAGIEVVQFALHTMEQSESSLRFPLWAYYLCVPVSMGLMALRYLQVLVENRSSER
jgi:C4-dicarboxylate transporter DctQ subunit